MNKKDLKCGFCKQGAEVQGICGKLWHDKAHDCTSHQRCMQYSASLSQYKMKKFGGFKIREVLREQNRGKKLKCALCLKNSRSPKSKLGGSASAGCAIKKCKKTFHFYCARTSNMARTRRIVLDSGRKGQESEVFYRVFCCKEHEDQFLEPNMKLTDDTDNDEYINASSSSDDGDKDVNEPDRESMEGESCVSEKQMVTVKRKFDLSFDNSDHVAKKSNVLKELDHYEETFVVCFMENAKDIPPSKFEVLVNQAKDLFNVDASNVFMWKYNVEKFSYHHMLHLLIEIGQALCDKNEAQMRHLICLLGNNDIARFDYQISAGEDAHKKDLEMKNEEYSQSLRKKIVEHFEKANQKFDAVVAKYCTIESLDSAHIAYLVLCKATDSSGEMRHHMKKSYTPDKDEQDDICEGCKKTFSVSAHDLEASLFHEASDTILKNHNKDPSLVEEEAKVLLEWLNGNADSLYEPKVYPAEEISISTSNTGFTVDCLCSLLRAGEKSRHGNRAHVIIIKPLDSQIVNVVNYLSRRISKVIEEYLTAQHDIYLFICLCRGAGIEKISEILPGTIFPQGPNSEVKVQAFTASKENRSGDELFVVLHLWIDL